jgi:2-phosphosulfolactate phosphatase
MKINCYLTPHEVDELALRERTVVVIDVLRATTSIVVALSNGAKEVIPATTVESATKIAGNLGGNVALLAGERNGRMVPGFDLGNSPAEYTEGAVGGRSIIFTSTNGSQALVRARYAQELVVCSFVNMSAVAEFLLERPRDVAVLCSGHQGALALEDTVCAGMLLSRLSDAVGDGALLPDPAVAAMSLYKSMGRSLLKMLKSSAHGRYLEEIGFGEDLKFCSQVDAFQVIPVFDGSVLRLKRTEPSHEHAPQTVNR